MTAQSEHDIGEKYSFNGHRESNEEPTFQFKGGGRFILDTDPDLVPLWGQGQECLQSDGEALVVAGPQGVGKTTLVQQYALAAAASRSTPHCSGFRSCQAIGTCCIWRWTGPSKSHDPFGAWSERRGEPNWMSAFPSGTAHRPTTWPGIPTCC